MGDLTLYFFCARILKIVIDNRKEIVMEKKKNLLTNPFVIATLAIFCCALWGSANPAVKKGYESILPGNMKNFAGMMLFAGLRFAIAGLLTIIIYSIARRRLIHPKLNNVGRVLGVSAFQTVLQYMFFFYGISKTTAVKSTILSGTSAFFAVIISCLIARFEKITVKKIIACLIGFTGVIIINLDGLNLEMTLTGEGFIIFSAVASSVASVLMKGFTKHEEPVILSGYQFFAGGVVMILIGIIGGAEIKLDTFLGWGILLYLASLSAVAYAIWGTLLKYNPVSKVAVYSFMIPVCGVIISRIAIPSEKINSVPLLLVALALVPLGIFLINYSGSLIPKRIKNRLLPNKPESKRNVNDGCQKSAKINK